MVIVSCFLFSEQCIVFLYQPKTLPWYNKLFFCLNHWNMKPFCSLFSSGAKFQPMIFEKKHASINDTIFNTKTVNFSIPLKFCTHSIDRKFACTPLEIKSTSRSCTARALSKTRLLTCRFTWEKLTTRAIRIGLCSFFIVLIATSPWEFNSVNFAEVKSVTCIRKKPLSPLNLTFT